MNLNSLHYSINNAAAPSSSSILPDQHAKRPHSAGLWPATQDGAVSNANTASAGSSGDSAGSITSNDFLTLLVSELKNQDPTAQTDPNSYINQLVQVNSLQQLISINQELGTNPSSTNGQTDPFAGQQAL